MSVAPSIARLALVAVCLMGCGGQVGCGQSTQSNGPVTPATEAKTSIVTNNVDVAFPTYSTELQHRIAAALQALGTDYKPRTKFFRADGQPRFTNRLVLESSPYLLQHAHNPVNWYSWGPEAFEKARRENKPVFLSIGYSTCHWCHVMERESFENPAIARFLNEHFVTIKVDREQRPDVDANYMTAVMVLTGGGGWPMSSFLTPAGQPFYGGTYFPPDAFLQLLQRINQLWHDQKDSLVAQAAKLAVTVVQINTVNAKAGAVGDNAIRQAVSEILDRQDKEFGGFDSAPKFPEETDLLLLLDTATRTGNQDAFGAAENALRAMARGGIYDQIGGGFHRYSTDTRWLIPHFEKMLYNQANLSQTYLRAWQATGDPLQARVVRQTLDFVLREMTAPDGGFYAALDADSEGREGAYYVWTPAQIRAVLSPKDADLAIALFGVTAHGNFEGANVLFLPQSLPDFAHQRGVPLDTLLTDVDRIRGQLLHARETRPHPLRDDKVITAWNGMMIGSFALAAEALQAPKYLQAATRAAEFLWQQHRRGPGELWRASFHGNASVAGVQMDSASFADALVTLYDVTGDAQWLQRAQELTDGMLKRFWDDAHGGFYMSEAATNTPALARPKDARDEALPSGNAVALRLLTRLAERTGEPLYTQRANALLAAFATEIQRQPSAFAALLTAADELLHGATGPIQYGAGGAVKVTARIQSGEASNQALVVRIHIAPGWHVNAHQPLSKDLKPTTVSLEAGGTIGDIAYPPPVKKSLGFQPEPLALYEGDLKIRAPINVAGQKSLRVRFQFQACNDKICLAPTSLLLQVAPLLK